MTALPQGALSWLHKANGVRRWPLGIVGSAAATALLPVLSRRLAAGDEARVLKGVPLVILPARRR